jgi:oligopeptide transport system substrate-binding protein
MNRWGLSLFALAALFVAGCGGPNAGPNAGGGASAKKVLRYPLPDNPTSLDPGVVQDGDTIDVHQQVFEGLVTWDEKNEVAPLLAEKWEYKEGGKVVVFTLKKGIKFHNGDEVTAADFKRTWERNANKELNSKTTGYMTDIVGVQDVIEGKTKEIKGVKVIDPQTLEITLDKPRPYFLGKLTFQVFSVLQKGTPATEIADPKQMIGTGPFMVDQYVPQAAITLKQNAEYHGGKPKLDAIERKVVKDQAVRLNGYRSGEFDLLIVERQDVDAINGDEKLKADLKFYDRPSTFYIGMNCEGKVYPPFKNRDVRRAFAMAIDRDTIVNTFLGGVSKPARSIIPPGIPGHRDASPAVLPFNPTEAKALLAKAGYPGGKGMPPLEIRFRQARKDISIVAEAVASQIKENLGVEVKLRETPWAAYLERYNEGQNAFYHMRWAADYLDPENFISFMLASYGPENKFGYVNPEVDKLCRQADSMMDLNARIPLYQKAEDMILQDAAWVPIYFQSDPVLVRGRLQGLRTSVFGYLPHTTTDLGPNP